MPIIDYHAGECHYRANEFALALPLFEQVIAAKVEKFLAQALYRAGACATKSTGVA